MDTNAYAISIWNEMTFQQLLTDLSAPRQSGQLWRFYDGFLLCKVRNDMTVYKEVTPKMNEWTWLD